MRCQIIHFDSRFVGQKGHAPEHIRKPVLEFGFLVFRYRKSAGAKSLSK